jgi:preprotein translocase subunit SecA
MFTKLAKALGMDPDKREVERLSKNVDQINALESEYEKLSDHALRAKTEEFRARLSQATAGIEDDKERHRIEQEVLNELLIEAFAAVREASKRNLGMRHFDVQLLGGQVLHEGKIAEMRTGEGKTLVATLPLYLNALLGRGAHLITVNDYLARRDARWMAPVFISLGMSVGVLQMASRTENGQFAFVIDLEKESPHEDQHQLRMVPRPDAYLADITYGTNSEFGFDYLRDNLTNRLDERVQRKHYYAIVDEVDNILIDEARTPLIISGPSHDDSEWYVRMSQVVRQLNPEDYEVNEKDRSISLTEVGEAHVEQLSQLQMRDPDRPEDITPEQARMMGYLEQAMRAQFLYRRNKDYLVQAGKVVIIDEFTGRLMPGRRWSDGLHQAVEAKEGVKVEAENVTYATITIQNYFRMYQKLAGMSGTAVTEGEEFWKIYKLDVLPIPTNLEYQASRTSASFMTVDAKDDQGYKYIYYTKRDDPRKVPLFWKRKDYPDVVYRTEEAKLRAITQEIVHFHVIGRPQLVGTTSVEHSERLSDRLSADTIRRLAQILVMRDMYLEMKNIEIIERAIPELQPLNPPLDKIETGDLRQLARSLAINMSFNPEEPANVERLLRILNLSSDHRDRLVKVLQGGIPHQVLNARKHDEESKIIAKAGSFGAVTIATNMAGRGVDIKLGGDLDEEILGDVNRVLERAGKDAYNMTNEERLTALQKLTEEDYGIYGEAVTAFYQYMHEAKQVRELGGLHVVGSERHEARRIDNQLRGRSARQGDPGSSRFYLALDDELMRLFGGKQVEGLMARLNIDESLPIESGIVGRLVEQSQERVEGSNFDMRKHLLEYDDVLNSQRKRIYEQRDRVFVKADLSDDLQEMLQTDLQARVPVALKDEEGPWKLVAYLDEIQPPIVFEDLRYPSFSMAIMIDYLIDHRPADGGTVSQLREELLTLASKALQAESDHMINSFRQLMDRSEAALETQRAERVEALDNFIESLSDRQEEGPLRVQELSDEVAGILRLPQFRLNNEQMRLVNDDHEDLRDQLRRLVDTYLMTLTINRVVGAVERRLGEPLNLRANQFQDMEWPEIAHQILQSAENVLERQFDRLLGDGKGISRDLDPYLERLSDYTSDEDQFIDLLGVMMEGQRMVFDRRTHRQGFQVTRRVNYAFLAGQMLQDRPATDVTADVLEQLQGAQETLQEAWGRYEWARLVQNNIQLGQLDNRLQSRLAEVMGKEYFDGIREQPLNALTDEERAAVQEALGWFDQNEATRQLLLGVISELWVDYLTRVEALRVSIGLEAYAQRDPLVQYKGRASEMFQQLLADIRNGVVSRLFSFRPRTQAPTVTDVRQDGAPAGAGAADGSSDTDDGGANGQTQVIAGAPARPGGVPQSSVQGKKKRKRH